LRFRRRVVPEKLEGFTPSANLLHLVKNEKDRVASGCSLGNSEAPLGFDPGGIKRNRAVGGSIGRWNVDGFLDLTGNGGLADLAGTDQDLNDLGRP